MPWSTALENSQQCSLLQKVQHGGAGRHPDSSLRCAAGAHRAGARLPPPHPEHPPGAAASLWRGWLLRRPVRTVSPGLSAGGHITAAARAFPRPCRLMPALRTSPVQWWSLDDSVHAPCGPHVSRVLATDVAGSIGRWWRAAHASAARPSTLLTRRTTRGPSLHSAPSACSPLTRQPRSPLACWSRCALVTSAPLARHPRHRGSLPRRTSR